MKLLKDILYKVSLVEVKGSTNIAINTIFQDSRKAENMGLFVAVKGTLTDGHRYIEDVVAKGAAAVVCEEFPQEINHKVTYVKVKNASESLGIIASNFFDNPSSKLKLIGVTGTNGKTTTVTLLFNLFRSLGYKAGLISTVKNKINQKEIASTHTTPDAISLNKLLQSMVEEGCSYCFMEVSSHAVVQHRVTGITYRGAVFTNITHDHLDYHKTFSEYLNAKKKFFDLLPADAFALVNKDDANGEVMLQNTKAIKKTFALKSHADFKCRVIENQLSGLQLEIDNKELYTTLIGAFNAYNILAVYAVAVLLNQDPLNVLTAISNLKSVEGRFQHIRTENGVIGIVDYAHTPDALLNVLKTINEIRSGNEKVITVVGCGGDRDKTKRPEMARIACENSHNVLITSDNPRSEDPKEIISDMLKGVEKQHDKKVITITDRREAINTACTLASNGDVILIAGKGHENYQEIKGVKHHFDDMEELLNCFKKFEK